MRKTLLSLAAGVIFGQGLYQMFMHNLILGVLFLIVGTAFFTANMLIRE